MFKIIEQTGVDLSSVDMCVSATVQRLKVFVVFKFVNRVTVSAEFSMETLAIFHMCIGLLK